MISSLYQPVFAPLLVNKKRCWGLLGLSAAHLGLTLLGLPSIPCPFLDLFGIPCLGCGLSRAMLLFVQGEWVQSLYYHLFAPLFLAGFVLLITSLFLPQPLRLNLIRFIEKKEQTGLTALVLLFLIIYWLIRFTFWRNEFIYLMMFNPKG